MHRQKAKSVAVGILQVFRGIRTATRGLIAAPWTPASLSLLPGRGAQATQEKRVCSQTRFDEHERLS